jgi:hypothetical protein
MKAYPYHTILVEDYPRDNVYHDHSDCPDGLRIKPEHKRQGTANRRRCDECIKKG